MSAPDGDPILAEAGRLGRALREHAGFRRLRDAEAAVLAAPESASLADALGRLQKERDRLRAEGASPSPDGDRSLERVAAAAAADPLLVELWRAQTEFQGLVDSVSRAMLAEIRGTG